MRKIVLESWLEIKGQIWEKNEDDFCDVVRGARRHLHNDTDDLIKKKLFFFGIFYDQR